MLVLTCFTNSYNYRVTQQIFYTFIRKNQKVTNLCKKGVNFHGMHIFQDKENKDFNPTSCHSQDMMSSIS